MNRYKLHEPIPFPKDTIKIIHVGMRVRYVTSGYWGTVTNEFVETKSGKYFFAIKWDLNDGTAFIPGELLEYE